MFDNEIIVVGLFHFYFFFLYINLWMVKRPETLHTRVVIGPKNICHSFSQKNIYQSCPLCAINNQPWAIPSLHTVSEKSINIYQFQKKPS